VATRAPAVVATATDLASRANMLMVIRYTPLVSKDREMRPSCALCGLPAVARVSATETRWACVRVVSKLSP
jgi:hypothetical protein